MEITTDTEAKAEEDSITTKPMEDQSTRMREVTYFSIMMATPLMYPNNSIQPLLFNPQLWKHPNLTEVEELQEVTEDPTEDEGSDKPEAMIKVSAQIEEQIEEHKEEITTDQIEALEEDKNPIEDPEKHMTKGKDSTEAQGEVQTKDREVEDLLSLIITIGTAWYARKEDTIPYSSVPSSRTIFQEVITSYQSPKRYVSNASQHLAKPIPVIMYTQEIIKTGCVTYTN